MWLGGVNTRLVRNRDLQDGKIGKLRGSPSLMKHTNLTNKGWLWSNYCSEILPQKPSWPCWLFEIGNGKLNKVSLGGIALTQSRGVLPKYKPSLFPLLCPLSIRITNHAYNGSAYRPSKIAAPTVSTWSLLPKIRCPSPQPMHESC